MRWEANIFNSMEIIPRPFRFLQINSILGMQESQDWIMISMAMAVRFSNNRILRISHWDSHLKEEETNSNSRTSLITQKISQLVDNLKDQREMVL